MYTSVNSEVQALSSKRLNKKSLPAINTLDRFPVISPALISRASRIKRANARHKTRLDILALSCLLAFSWKANTVLAQIKDRKLINGRLFSDI
jgi:hypothetical protein